MAVTGDLSPIIGDRPPVFQAEHGQIVELPGVPHESIDGSLHILQQLQGLCPWIFIQRPKDPVHAKLLLPVVVGFRKAVGIDKHL